MGPCRLPTNKTIERVNFSVCLFIPLKRRLLSMPFYKNGGGAGIPGHKPVAVFSFANFFVAFLKSLPTVAIVGDFVGGSAVTLVPRRKVT